MFCSYCGNELAADARFCRFCGKAVAPVVIAAPAAYAPVAPAAPAATYSPAAAPAMNFAVAPAPGFSARINDPSLTAAVKQGGKAAAIFAVLLIAAPLVICLILGLKDGDFSYLGIGAVISVVFLVVNLISGAKKKAQRQWDGVVMDKRTRRATNKDDDVYTQYVVEFRTDAGKRQTLTEGTAFSDAHPYFDYLNVGDRVRHHPQFNCFYEKFDKSRDAYLLCAVCGKPSDVREERCGFCNAVLVK